MLSLENIQENILEELEVQPSIMMLPREIRGIIYSKISQNERVKLRLVCSQWRVEIDELCEFSVNIDDTKENWDRVFQLRLEACEVAHFLKPPPNGTGTRCLKYANLLQSLKILTDYISPENFYYLLSDSSKSITQLSLQLAFPLLGQSFTSSFASFDFRRLNRLELSVSTLPTSETFATTAFPFEANANKNSEILFIQLLANPMVQLKHLKIELNVLGNTQVSRMASSVLQFISLHWKILQSVDFELMQGHGMPTAEFRPLKDSDLEKIDFISLGKLRNLKSLRVVSSSPVGVNIWIDLIVNQSKMEIFEADLLPVPSSVFQNMIIKNNKTLTACEITDLTVWDIEGDVLPFDLCVFQNCFNLSKLILDRNVISRRRYDCAELINLNCLPDNLNELALNYFNVLSEDFILFFNSPSGYNLKNLTLNQCGNSGPFGTNGSVMERIISLPFIIFIEISPLNFTDPAECHKLNGILLRHGYSEGHSYFQLAKLEALIHFGNLLNLENRNT